jgi:tetratricopeptide (TPR) repeat protein
LYQEALAHFKLALEYPDNLEVGRPVHGGRYVQVCYFIAKAYEALGIMDPAEEFFTKASNREGGVSELTFYQALACRELGRHEEADALCLRLRKIAVERLDKAEERDFFVKFGEERTEEKRKAQAHYLLGLGLLGSGETERARLEFKSALELDKNHVWANYYVRNLQTIF